MSTGPECKRWQRVGYSEKRSSQAGKAQRRRLSRRLRSTPPVFVKNREHSERVRLQMESRGSAREGSAYSTSHGAEGVGIQVVVVMIEPKEQCQADGNLRRRHGQDEEKHDLAVRLAPSRSRRDERDPRAVQHDLNRHQNEDQITAHQYSGQPQRKQYSRQNQRVTHRNSCHKRASAFPDTGRPRWEAPTRAPSSNMEASSTPIREGPYRAIPTCF